LDACDVQAKELLTACREAGVNFFDNAEVYAKGQAEEIMGEAFKVCISSSLSSSPAAAPAAAPP
jgi:aryl-alcohol dehydrogenase-like predicted oxidoreductase